MLACFVVGCGTTKNTTSETAPSPKAVETVPAPPKPAPEVTVNGIKYAVTSVSRESSISADMGTDTGDFIMLGCSLTNTTSNELKDPSSAIYLRNKATGEKYYMDMVLDDWYTSQTKSVNSVINSLKGGESTSGYLILNINRNSVNANSSVSSPSDLALVFFDSGQDGSGAPTETVLGEVDLANVQ